MSLLNFRELSVSRTAVEAGENFEGLVRELGKRLSLEPAWSGRGADQGRDLIFTERRRGTLGFRDVRWLVSCKNFAQSGTAVKEGDVGAVLEKTAQHNASGFLLATTTTASTGLKSMLDAFNEQDKIHTKVWDRHELEQLLLQENNLDLVKRYMPESYISLQRLSNLPLALASLEAMMPQFIYERVVNILKSYQAEDGWLSGEHIWPFDERSSKIIDTVLAELLEHGRPAMAARLLTAGGVEFDAFSATLDVLGTLKPDAAEQLSRELISLGDPKGPSLFAYRFYVTRFEPNNDEQIEIVSNLDPEDLSEIYADEIADFIEEEMISDPGQFRAWDDLDCLSSHTRLEEVYVYDIEFSTDKDHRKINFKAKLRLSVELAYDREVGSSTSYPGQATGYIDANGMYLEDATADTSSFYI